MRNYRIAASKQKTPGAQWQPGVISAAHEHTGSFGELHRPKKSAESVTRVRQAGKHWSPRCYANANFRLCGRLAYTNASFARGANDSKLSEHVAANAATDCNVPGVQCDPGAATAPSGPFRKGGSPCGHHHGRSSRSDAGFRYQR